MLRLQTLGGLFLETDDGVARGAAAQRRPLALLALLAIQGGMSRDKVMALLWPESDQTSARNRLKQTVYALRRDLSCPDLVLGSAELRLNPAVITVDVWEFLNSLDAGTAALELYRGPFLDGVYLSEAPEFERWAEEQRVALAHRFSTAAESAVAKTMAAGDFGQALTVARRMAGLEPLNSRIAISVVSALAAAGDPAGAIQYARSHCALLKEELDVDAEPEMGDLIESIRSQAFGGFAHAIPPSVKQVQTPSELEQGDSPASGVSSSAVPTEARSQRRRRWRPAAAIVVLAVFALSAIGAIWLRSARAWTAFRLGRASAATWDGERARSHFRAAITADTAFAEAYLALAELASWRTTDPAARDEQRWAARLAIQYRSRLSPPEQTRAEALLASADGRWTEACRRFDTLIGQDSTSYSAWFGRAECLARDGAVVADSGSPSGWRFRTSYQAAIAAYLRTFALRPDFHRAFSGQAIAHLSRVLFLQPNRARRGVSNGGAPTQFAALPSWAGDTIAFIPYPVEDIQRRRPGSTPSTTLDAIAHNRETLRRLTASWIASSPESADAFEAHASVLELLGQVDEEIGGTSAGQSLATARRLSTVPEQRLRLAVADVRFRVKQMHFHDARTLSDSLLAAWPDPTTVVAQWLAPIAAVTGRTNLAVRLQRVAAPLAPPPTHGRVWSDPPPPLISEWVALTTFAVLGGPVDSLATTYHQFESLTQLVEPAARSAIRAAMLQEPARFEPERFPDSVWNVLDTLADPIAQMERSAHRRDRDAVRKRFASLETARAHFRLADRWPDAVFLESRTLLAIGDTTDAVAMVDPYLAALPVLNSAILDRVQTAGSIARLMSLRADVARARGENSVARRWSSAVAALNWAKD